MSNVMRVDPVTVEVQTDYVKQACAKGNMVIQSNEQTLI